MAGYYLESWPAVPALLKPRLTTLAAPSTSRALGAVLAQWSLAEGEAP